MIDSKNGFQTKIWGPPAWFFLHIASLNYSPERKKGYKKFFTSLVDILPCGKCRTNYKKILKSKKLTDDVLSSRRKFARWLFEVHNRVQYDIYESSGNPEHRPIFKNTDKDFMKAMMFYEKYRAGCSVTHGCMEPKKGKKMKSVVNISAVKSI